MNAEDIARTVLDGHVGVRENSDADYWKRLQAAIEDGQVMDELPYRRRKRFGSITENGPSPRATGGMST